MGDHLLEEYHQLSEAWRAALDERIPRDHLERLHRFVEDARASSIVYPPLGQVFTALRLCPLEETRVVILGQDPYHGEGQAHGLSFSVREEMKLPPSLRNIFKELDTDLGIPPVKRGDLTRWAEQGVLMLNTVLTVRASEAHSHKRQGWEELTDAMISAVSARCEHVVFILWGKPAQKKRALIDDRHTSIESAHPSPLSARRGFFGSAPFSRVNAALTARGQTPINWSLA